jgi:hypothetical protein
MGAVGVSDHHPTKIHMPPNTNNYRGSNTQPTVMMKAGRLMAKPPYPPNPSSPHS